MIDASAHRIASHDSGGSGETVTTTEGGQDKRAHVALRSVGCFCRIFDGIAHLATALCKVPYLPEVLLFRRFGHIAELCHGR